MAEDFVYHDWEAKKKEYAKLRAQGQCVLWQKGRRLQVVCPYNAKFVQKAIALAGNWRDKSGIWSFRVQSFGLVLQVAQAVFGKENITQRGSIQGPVIKRIK